MPRKPYGTGLVLGRFQGLHKGHEAVIRRALSLCRKVCVMIGSADKEGTPHNPFSLALRREMLERVFAPELRRGRLVIYPLPDLGVGNVPAWGDYVLENAERCLGKPDCVVYGDEDKCRTWFPNHPEICFETLDRQEIAMTGTKLRGLILAGDRETFEAYTHPALHGLFDALRKELLEAEAGGLPDNIPDAMPGACAGAPAGQTP